MKRVPIIKIKNPKEVFLLFAALNTFGYNAENNRNGMSLVRKKVRRIFEKFRKQKNYPTLKQAITTHHPYWLLKTILDPKSRTLKNFRAQLWKFSSEPSAQRAWDAFQSYQTREMRKLRPVFKKEAAGLIAFVGKTPQSVEKIILTPNPLDTYWRGYGFTIRGTGYIIVGPGADQRHNALLRHELLHILAPSFRLPKKFTAVRSHKHLAANGYATESIINREYIVRGLSLLYESKILKLNTSRSIKSEQRDFPYIKEVIKLLHNKRGYHFSW